MYQDAQPEQGTVYRRKTDGTRLKYAGPSGSGQPEFYKGWIAAGPGVFGKLVGPAWGWPSAYEVDPDQSWPENL